MEPIGSLVALNKNNKIPYYLQIKEQIKKKIDDKILLPNTKLPTERELSAALQVSRNTISTAYKELETEGYVTSLPGKGTFVFLEENQKNKRETILKQIESLCDQAAKADYNFEMLKEDFLEVWERKKNALHVVKAVFLECNREQLNYLSGFLSRRFNIHIVPILIDDIKDNVFQYIDELRDCNLVITTIFHIDEVKKIFQNFDAKIVAVALEMNLDTMVEISKIEEEDRVSLFCYSKKFAQNVNYLIGKINPKIKKIQLVTFYDDEIFENLYNNSDVILYSPKRKRYLPENLLQKNCIEVVLNPDEGSLNFLEEVMNDIKNH